MATVNFLKLAEITLAYRQWGQGSPVVLLHGLADAGTVWQGIADRLQDNYHCLAPDLRGHGDSDKPTAIAAYDARVVAQDLEEWAAALGLGDVVVVAHSWSAKVALLWAKQCPQRCRSLILVDPFFVNRLPKIFRFTFPLLYRTLPFLKVMGPFANPEAAIAVAQTLKQYRGWSPLQAAVFQSSLELKPDGSWGSKFAIAARDGVFQDILQRPGLSAPLPVPTCLLLPTGGLNRMAWQLQPYRTHLPHLTQQTIPGNHWPHLVEPEACATAIAAGLRQLAAG